MQNGRLAGNRLHLAATCCVRFCIIFKKSIAVEMCKVRVTPGTTTCTAPTHTRAHTERILYVIAIFTFKVYRYCIPQRGLYTCDDAEIESNDSCSKKSELRKEDFPDGFRHRDRRDRKNSTRCCEYLRVGFHYLHTKYLLFTHQSSGN